MDLNDGDVDRRQGIPDRNAGMGIGGWIDDNALAAGSGFLNPGDELALLVLLADIKGYSKVLTKLQ